MIIKDKKITINQLEKQQSPMELDLLAIFKVMEEQIINMTFDDEKPPEKMITEIAMLLGQSKKVENNIAKSDQALFYKEYQGLLIGIESPKGTYRKGKDKGKPWTTYMHYDYGFIYNALANDGDSLDVYLKDELSDKVYVIRQINPVNGTFDEYKCMLGFQNREEAFVAYVNQYDSRKYFGGMQEYSFDDFRNKLFGGNYE